MNMLRSILLLMIIGGLTFGCDSRKQEGEASGAKQPLRVEHDQEKATIAVYKEDGKEAMLTQHVKENFRPYLHPIIAPDGTGELTEYSPGHHEHQTGLYWGFTRVNGRDFFHNPGGDYWRRESAEVIKDQGDSVRWKMVYHLLDDNGNPLMTASQTWSMRVQGEKYLLDLEWSGEAQTEITIGAYDYGGLFLRMPWKEGMHAEVVNAARQRNEKAEGQPAMWLDVGMQVPGRDDFAHIAIFDHPENRGFPQHWRVDGQFGVGPAPTRTKDWHIAEGETENLRYQLVVYTGEFNDVELTNSWKNFSGNQSTSALWEIARQEGREAEFLTAEEAVENMSIKEGFEVNSFASEPMISQPMAFCWDDQGRLWVAENHDYESRGHGFSNSGDSRIVILEDTNGDGKADSKEVFLEGIAFPAAMAVGFDGLFLGAPPNLLYVPDKDGDDQADVDDIEVLLTGWGIRDRHETLNSLNWGPDGWLYGLQGFATPSKVRKPKGEGRLYRHNDPFPEDLLEGEGVEINGGVWRYHPVKERFEVVAHGFSNPWGIDYDAKGQLIMTACVIPHLWHVVPGGVYHRQGGQHFNPYVYDDIKTIADHRHRSAHGGARVYLSDAFPEEEHGRIFMANIHEHAVLSDILEPEGSGFTGRHGDDFMMANNAQWVGFSMELGPEGALYVLDWHDADICGQEVLNEETGRIFRITPEESKAEDWEGRYANLSDMNDDRLVQMQTRKSAWHARRARLILQNRATKGELDKNTHDQLRKMFRSQKNTDWRLRAMWALHITGGFDNGDLINALEDEEEYIRAWAVQLLCEDKSPSRKAISKFETMAGEDPSPVVRRYLASALQRMDQDFRWDIAEALLQHPEDAGDHNIPKMIWLGVEPLVEEDPGKALKLAAQSEIPLLTRFIARRSVDANALEPLVAAIGKEPETIIHLLEGAREGLEGSTDLTAPSNWDEVYGSLTASDDKIARLGLEIAQQFGDSEAAKAYLNNLKDKNASIESRREALQSLAKQQSKELIEMLPGLLDDRALRKEAIRAVAAYDNKDLGRTLMERYDTFNDEEKAEVVQTMASRPAYGGMLTQALDKGEIPKRDVPVYVARQLRRVVGNGFVEVYGPIDQQYDIDEQKYEQYRRLLTPEALGKADVQNGRVVFRQTCGPCHKMYGEGGDIGPDITGSNRTNLEYLLFQVLDPGAEVQDDYKMVMVTTRDGRNYSGNVIGENDRQITMRVIGQDDVVINKSEIQVREKTEKSMMPPGLFDALPKQDVIDLVAYLQSEEQVNLP